MLRLYVLGQNLANQLKNSVARAARREEGATMVEYGLLVALIAIACIVAITTMSGGLQTLFGTKVVEKL